MLASRAVSVVNPSSVEMAATSPGLAPGQPPPGTVDGIRRALESGHAVAAYRAAAAAGWLAAAASTPERALLVARVLRACGARRRARALVLGTWRRHRRHPAAALAAAQELATTPLTALDALAWIGEVAGLADASGEDRAAWACLRVSALAELRDFVEAEAAWRVAAACHDGLTTWCTRAELDLALDRPADALVAVARARAARTWSPSALDLESRALIRARRPVDARALLVEASGRVESYLLDLALAVHHRNAGALDGAVAALVQAAGHAPAMERGLHDYLARELSRLHELRGERALAAHLRGLASDADAEDDAARILAAQGRRHLLAVPHVPQDHHTCAPATLTALAEYWGHAVSHADVAEDICHDGTPAGSERRWAEDAGFVARQLTVTWDALRGLLDAGVPVALTTSFTLGGHLQPVAGYDERRRTALVQEPGAWGLVELDWDELAEDQAPFGPRGLALVPQDQAHRLDGVELPDAGLYDLLFAIEVALSRHDRPAAQRAHDALVAAAPDGHYLVHQARRALASYDGDHRSARAWVEGLRARFPAHTFLRWMDLATRSGHEAVDERAAEAAALLAAHDTDAAMLVTCAQVLAALGDAPCAIAAATRAIAAAPSHAPAYRRLAGWTWTAGDRGRAVALFRFASTLAEGDEGAAWAYFGAALVLPDEVERALAHLLDRAGRMHARSGGPARTLCEAFDAIGRGADADAWLARALDAHPDEGELLLLAAERRRRVADLDGARDRLAAARGKVADRDWRRARAALDAQAGDLGAACEGWRALVEDDPLDVAAHAEYAALLERTGRADLARAHVVEVAARHPFHVPLAELADDLLSRQDPVAARAHLEAFVARQPTCAWALRRLARLAIDADDLRAAQAWLARARACADDLAAIDALDAALATRAGDRDRAITRLLAAIARDVDEPGAVHALLALASDAAEATGWLDVVARELARQGTAGHGLLGYAAALRTWVDGPSALARLRELRRARPHQWHAWAAEVDGLVDAGRYDDAAVVAREAAERFPHEPRAWRQLAQVEARRDRGDAAVAALTRALAVAPHDTAVMRAAASLHARHGRYDAARAVLARAIAEEPLEPGNHAVLATVLDEVGERAAARAALIRAIELEPDDEPAWARLDAWTGASEPVVELARAALARDAAAIAPRVYLAEHDASLALDARVALLDQAIALAPDRDDLHDARALVLATHERWDEALAACRPTFWGDAPPVSLRARAAWIRFQRGEHAAAIADMLAVVQGAPEHAWAIARLIDWADEVGDPVGVGEQLTRAAPRSARAHAWLGEARRCAGDSSGAEAALRRALDLDASDRLARLALFDVYYASGRLDAAARLLDGLEPDDPFHVARRVQVAAATGRLDDADREMTRMLVELQVSSATPVAEAIDGYVRAGERRRAQRLLDELILGPDAPAAVGQAWWDHGTSFGGRWMTIRSLPRSRAADLCAERYALGLARGSTGRLLWFAYTNRRRARDWPVLWGAIGAALVEAAHYWLAIRWMRDHARRDGAAGWMLTYLARAQVASNALVEAVALCRRALALPRDGMTGEARLLLAPLVAVDEPAEAARALAAARAESPHLGGDARALAALADAIVRYVGGSDRGPAAKDTLTRALAAVWADPVRRPSYVVRRIYDHLVERLTVDASDPGAASAWRATLRRLPLGF